MGMQLAPRHPAGANPPALGMGGGLRRCFLALWGDLQLVRLWNRFPETAMIGPEFSQVLSAHGRRGSEEAFGRLWHDLQPRVLRYFAVVSPAAAEDLASETWLGVVRGIGLSRYRPAFRAWVFTIARHEALDRWRRAAHRQRRTLPSTV